MMKLLPAAHDPESFADAGSQPHLSGGGAQAGIVRATACYLAVAVVLILLVTLPFATDYVGADNDDVMRLIEVRDLIAGQGWFDMMQYRLGLDGGTLMHWSRLIDLPIANLISFFGLFLDPQRAEAAALMVWPLLLVPPVLFFTGLAGLRLGGRQAMHAGFILAVILLVSGNRFRPGSIDHHNVQISLIAGIVAMLLDPRHRASNFMLAGCAAGLAIAIGAETTPLVAAACLIVAFQWGWHGGVVRFAAEAFSLMLGVTVTACFFLTTPAYVYTKVTCDNLSAGFYTLSVLGAGSLFLAAALMPRAGRRARFAALAAAGTGLAVVTLLVAPQCLQNPLNDLDPLLQALWLSGVAEAQSFSAQLARDPGSVAGYYAVGFLALVVCLYRMARRDRLEAHAVLLALISISVVVAMVQLRGAAFVNLLSIVPLAAAIADTRRLANANPKRRRLGLGFAALTIASVPSAWAVAGLLIPGPGRDMAFSKLPAASGNPTMPACNSPSSFAILGREPAGTVAASSDLGPEILRYTGHRVLSAPYHRNQAGMLAELHIGMAGPQAAETLLQDAGVAILAYCPTDPQTQRIAQDSPQGLYATLAKGDVPNFLTPVEGTQQAALRIFRVVRP